MTQYQRGRSFEYRVKKDLEKRGYFVVRAAQSKGIVDLLAIKATNSLPCVLFVQCKLTGICGYQEWNTLLAKGTECAARPVLAMQDAPRKPLQYWWLMHPKKKGVGRYANLGNTFTP